MKKGIYYDLPAEDYHASEGTSASKLKKIIKSPAHFFEEKEEEEEKKEHFEVGKAFEEKLLEPHKNNIVVFDPSKRPEPNKKFSGINKVWKELFYLENKDKIIIDTEAVEDINKMLSSTRENKLVSPFLSGNILVQPSIYFEDEETGELLKTRPDVVKMRSESSAIIIDVKTIEDASPESFFKQMAKLNYGIQAGMQIEGVRKEMKVDVDYYLYLVVEKSAPYTAQLYGFNSEDMEFFVHSYKTLVRRLAKARKDEQFKKSGYSFLSGNKTGIIEVKVPNWYKNNLIENLTF